MSRIGARAPSRSARTSRSEKTRHRPIFSLRDRALMRIFPTRSALRFGLRALLVAPVFFVGETCTKLTEVPHDALTPTTAFHTDAEVLAGVAGVYAQLRAIEWVGYIILQDLTTDVAIVPTRGSDWYDNGQWLDLHRQTWTSNSSGTLAFIDG